MVILLHIFWAFASVVHCDGPHRFVEAVGSYTVPGVNLFFFFPGVNLKPVSQAPPLPLTSCSTCMLVVPALTSLRVPDVGVAI